jgi:hypothetical protein
VVAGDHNDDCPRQRPSQTREMRECEQDRWIRRPHRVEDVAADEDHVGLELDRAIDRALEGARYIRLTLIDASALGGQSLELAETEMYVREVDEAHTSVSLF